MPKHVSTAKELRSMSAQDLRRDIAEQRSSVAKMRIGVTLKSEKNTASYSRAKKQLARQLTILRQIEQTESLKTQPKTPKVPAPNN
jgi:ribosomal protein L29